MQEFFLTTKNNKGISNLLTNYQPIPVLQCFSKILEPIMYDRLYTFFSKNLTIFEKHFGFRAGHSTYHAALQLMDQTCECLMKKEFFRNFCWLIKSS